jgi:CHAD domain-containing protein
MKRLKSLLRLLDYTGTIHTEKALEPLRQAGRQVGPLRDQEVFRERRDELEKDPDCACTYQGMSRVLKALSRNPASEKTMAPTFQVIQETKKFTDKISDLNLTPQDIAHALKRSIRRCRKAYAKARKTLEPADFHRMRRRTKDLFYQLELLKPVLRKNPSNLCKGLKEIGKLAGDAHDWHQLAEYLKHQKDLGSESKAVILHLEDKMNQCNQAAMKLAKPWFSKKSQLQAKAL